MFAWAEEFVSACRILRNTFGKDLSDLVSAKAVAHEFDRLHLITSILDDGASDAHYHLGRTGLKGLAPGGDSEKVSQNPVRKAEGSLTPFH